MAAYTSSQTGPWSVASTWGGGGVPGDGDTAAIGAHTVTVDTSTTVGTSPASLSMVITVADSGALTLAEDVILTVKGGIQCNSAPLTLSAGAGITVVAGAGVNYRIQPGVTGDPLGALYCNGTLAKHCAITKTGAGTAELYHYLSTSSGEFKCDYTDFSNLGGAGAAYAIRARRDLQLNHCTFDNCGIIDNNANTVDAAKNLSVVGCTFRNSLGDYVMDVRCTTAPDSGKVRRIAGNTFDIRPIISELRDGTVEDNYFAVEPSMSSATYRPTTWRRNFIVTGVGSETPVATILNDYRYNPSTDNAHLGAVSPGLSQTWDGIIFESAIDWVLNEHDGVILASEPVAPRTVTVQNCLTLPTPTGKCSCTIFTAASNTNTVWRVKNNTFFAGDRGRGFIGVHWAGQAGMLEYFKNNLGWANSGDASATLLESDPLESIAADYVTMCDYNGYWHMATAYDVDPSAFAGVVGANDLAEVNPSFVDSSRNLAKWAQVVLGKTGTDAQLRTAALAALANQNDPSSPSYHVDGTVANLITWVKAGFAPTNMAYATASDTDSWIGAFEPVLLSSGAISMMFLPF